MKFGDFEIHTFVEAAYSLDGGLMFGVIPKIMWQKMTEVDENNLIPMVNNLYLLKAHGKNMIFDIGLGDTLSDKENKYFIEDLSVKGDVRFLNSKSWPYAFEVNPSEGNILISKPIGNQPGLGALGFCYVPYHFVYSVKYPVLVQILDGEEIFQFPMAVVIQGNNPRESLDVDAVNIQLTELCSQKNTEIQVNTFDTKLNPIESEISYECFGVRCDIGKTTGGTLKEDFPQCTNGFVVSKADGFKEAAYQFSTVESGEIDIIMDRLYETNIDLKIDSRDYNGQATISFITDSGVETIVYPEQKTINFTFID